MKLSLSSLFRKFAVLGLLTACGVASNGSDIDGPLVYISNHLNVHIVGSVHSISRHLGRSDSYFFGSAGELVKKRLGVSVNSREEAFFELSTYTSDVGAEDALNNLRVAYLDKVADTERHQNTGSQYPENDLASLRNALEKVSQFDLGVGPNFMVFFTDPTSPFIDECEKAIDFKFNSCHSAFCTKIEKRCFSDFFPGDSISDPALQGLTWFQAIGKFNPGITRDECLQAYRNNIDELIRKLDIRLVIGSATDVAMCRTLASCFVVPPEEILLTLQEMSQSAAFEDDYLNEIATDTKLGSPRYESDGSTAGVNLSLKDVRDTYLVTTSSMATYPTESKKMTIYTGTTGPVAGSDSSIASKTFTPSFGTGTTDESYAESYPVQNDDSLVPTKMATAGAPLLLAVGLTGGIVYKRRQERYMRSDDEYDGDFPDDLSGFSSI